MRTIKFLLAILVSIAVAACGGGGSSTPTPPATYTISGTVVGAVQQGVTITLNGGAPTITAANGSYSFTGLANGNYTVAPSLAGFAFSPTSTIVTVSGSNVGGKNFTATAAAATYSISGTVSGSASVGVTITLSGANTGSMQTGADGTYIFSGLVPGSYTVTPFITGHTFSPTNIAVTITADSPANDFVATAYVGATYALSGTVTGPYVEGVTITLTGGQTTTTDVNGAYSFAALQPGSYIVTPSLAGYTYTPAAPSVTIVAADMTQNFVASSAVASYSISGAVSYPGSLTGTVYLRVYPTGCTGNCSPTAGTIITLIAGTPGAYTIRGLQPGDYFVNAEMDTLNTGVKNANNPTGIATAAIITTTDLTNVDIALADPATPVPVMPTGLTVFPSNNAALVMWDGSWDVNGAEIATSYKVYWGTDPAAATGGFKQVIARDDSFLVLSSLPDGITNGPLYVKVSALVGTAESAASTPVLVTIGATTGLNAVSGTVTYTGAASGPMLVGVYSDTMGVYFTTITSPSSPQPYNFAGVPNGDYFAFAMIDMNNNGVIDTGDISSNDSGGQVTVSSNLTGNNITLSSASATASVTTGHTSDGANESYNVNLEVSDGTKRVVKVTLVSGLNVPLPLDLGKDWEFQTWVNFGTTSPTVGDSYVFEVTYSDNTSTTETLTGSVNAVLGTDAMAQTLTVDPIPSAGIPTFSWTAPAVPPTSYTYSLSLSGNNANWYYPQDGDLPSTTLSAEYNVDNNATPASLVGGQLYIWQVEVKDANGNSATFESTYTP